MFGPPDVTKLRNGRKVKRLEAALTYRDVGVRRDAAWSLGTLAGDVRLDVGPLARAWRDDDGDANTRDNAGWALVRLACYQPDQAEEAIDALVAADPARGVRALLDAATGPPKECAARAGELLGEVLSGLGREGVDLVVTAIRDSSSPWQVTGVARTHLARMPADTVIAVLVPVLRSEREEPVVRNWAADVLCEFEDPRVLAPLLAAHARGGSRVIADRLPDLADRHPDSLCAATRDADPLVRRGAVDIVAGKATGAPDDPMTATLLEALADADDGVRACAAVGAGTLGLRPPALPALLSAVLAYPEEKPRLEALAGLARAGEPAAIEALLATAADRDRPIELRQAAVRRLDALPLQQVLEPLLDLLAEDSSVASAAEQVLGDIGDRSCVDRLVALLPEDPAGARAAAVLGRLGDPRAVEPLVAALEELRTKVAPRRDCAATDKAVALAQALGRLGDRRAVPAVSKALNALRPNPGTTLDELTGWRAVRLIDTLGRLRDRSAVPALLTWTPHLLDLVQEPEYDSEGGIWGQPPDPFPLETAWAEALERIGGHDAAAALTEHGVQLDDTMIREWARLEGLAVPDSGKVPQAVRNAFER
jgi:HEAT repeat protein